MSNDSIHNNEVGRKSTPVLSIENVTKDFGYRQVLRKVNLVLNNSEMVLLLGKNGAGKSTLLKIIAGLIRPSGGNIYFKGENISDQPEELRKSIGVISHAAHFYGELTARENLEFFANLRKVENLKEKVKDALEETGLLPFTDVPLKTFSSGMYKRLNIARIIVFQPQILLLDEPYTGLDYDSTRFFNTYIDRSRQQGAAILMISHQPETCYDISDRVLILHRGSIRASYKTEDYECSELIRTYQNIGTTEGNGLLSVSN